MSLPSFAWSILMDAILQFISFKLTSKKMSKILSSLILKIRRHLNHRKRKQHSNLLLFSSKKQKIFLMPILITQKREYFLCRKYLVYWNFISYAYFSYFFSCPVYLELQLRISLKNVSKLNTWFSKEVTLKTQWEFFPLNFLFKDLKSAIKLLNKI